jgi:hypothetical protein
VISYWDFADPRLRIAKCTNASCGSSVLTTVDYDGGRVSSLNLGSDGLPVVSCFDGSPGTL